MPKAIGQEADEREMKEARRSWKKLHPGITGGIHDLVERSYEAGYWAGMRRGLEKRGDPITDAIARYEGWGQDDLGKWHMGDCNARNYAEPCMCDAVLPEDKEAEQAMELET